MPFPVEDRFIVLAEEKLGVRFPSSFHEGMQKVNGGEVSTSDDHWQLYPVFDTSDKKRLKRTANNIVRETKSAREWHGFPAWAVAIGENGCGDLAILKPLDDDQQMLQDRVYMWCHETLNISPLFDNIQLLMQQRC